MAVEGCLIHRKEVFYKKHMQISVISGGKNPKDSSSLDQRLVNFELDTCILGYVLTWDCFDSNCSLRQTK